MLQLLFTENLAISHVFESISMNDYYFKIDLAILKAKTMVLNSCTVTAQLICTFVFAYARRRFCTDITFFLTFIFKCRPYFEHVKSETQQ